MPAKLVDRTANPAPFRWFATVDHHICDYLIVHLVSAISAFMLPATVFHKSSAASATGVLMGPII
jgi:hypothetical protein